MPLLQFLCLLPQKHRAGLWIEELGCFILFFLLLAKLLQCLFFHSGALLCPDLVFGFSFPCILAIWFLKASCSSFGFCCSCHLVHLQDKRKKPTGGLPLFYPLTAPLWGSSWSTRTFPLHNGSLGAGWEQSYRAWTSTSRSSGLGAGCQPPWAGLSPITGFSLVSLLLLVFPTANCQGGISGTGTWSIPLLAQCWVTQTGAHSFLSAKFPSDTFLGLFSTLRSVNLWATTSGWKGHQLPCICEAQHFLRMVFIIHLPQPYSSLPVLPAAALDAWSACSDWAVYSPSLKLAFLAPFSRAIAINKKYTGN